VAYGWRDFDQSVVRGIARADPRFLDKDPDGGMKCPLLGQEGDWLRWQDGNHARGTMPHGSPALVFRVKPTYILSDRLANFIVGHDLIEAALDGHWGKAETHRLGHENSEDALTFNVFRSLQEAGHLSRVAELVTGVTVAGEPELFLWGRRINPDGSTQRWRELQTLRDRVEPEHRQQTEPDVCLHLRGWGWIFIEAKFDFGIKTAANAKKLKAWCDLYPSHAPSLFDRERLATAVPRKFPEQLLRNMVFADLIRGGENAHVVALGRERDRTPIAAWVAACLADGCAVSTSVVSWEQVYRALLPTGTEVARLRDYLEAKSHSLRPAFNLTN
jgi:hypothetical protein